ncbi:hypothetical protein NMG60_11020923 [Bertholletia excelsa]
MADPSDHFKKGSEVEISSNDDGFRGAWYAGTVVRRAPARGKDKGKVLVEYKTLTADEAGKRPLQEMLDVVQLRPPAPRERCRSFKFSEEVDAYFNDGWWEGVITEVLENDKYSVFFRGTREQLEFGSSELRLHREWVKGQWVPPPEGECEELGQQKVTNPRTLSKDLINDKFSEGMLVEVSSDEDGFQGAWFAATIIEKLSEDKFMIEYKSLRNEDDTEFLREEADILHIRPNPPDTIVADHFNLFEEVDALYNDGWWVGVVSKVLKGQRYKVYFRGTDEEIVFQHSDLRIHQDWIDGKWVMPSQALKL